MPIHIPEAQRNDETREELRKQAMASTFVMGSIIGFHDLTNALHLPMCNWMDRSRSETGFNRLLGVIPRDHLKTSCWTIAYTIRRVTVEPSVRILLANETATNSEKFLRRIQAVPMRNGLWKWLFPERVPDFGNPKWKWSETEALFPREDDFPESTIETIGVGGAAVSRHYTLIKLDDLVGKAAENSVKVMKDTIDWYQYCESLLVNPQNEIHVVGTPWGFNDLIRWIGDNEGEYFSTFKTGCFGPDGEPIWPERFPRDELLRLRKKYGPYKFSCQYLCDPSDPDANNFRSEWLRKWRWSGDEVETERGERLNMDDFLFFIRIDPAISEKEDAARSAVIVDGVYRDGRKFLFEDWAERCDPFRMLEVMFEFVQKYKPISVGVEGVAYQRILKPIIERLCAVRGIWVNVVTFTPDSRERKVNRILGSMQPVFARGEYWVRDDHVNFIDEYMLFPTGRTVDVLDAVAYGPHQWIEPNEDREGDEDLLAEQEFERDVMFGERDSVTGY